MKLLFFLSVILFFYEVQAQPEVESKTQQVQSQDQAPSAEKKPEKKAEPSVTANRDTTAPVKTVTPESGKKPTKAVTPTVKVKPVKAVTSSPDEKVSSKVTAVPTKAVNPESSGKPSTTAAETAGPVTPESTTPVPAVNIQGQQQAGPTAPVAQKVSTQLSGESDLQKEDRELKQKINVSKTHKDGFSDRIEKSRWSFQTGLSHYLSNAGSLTQMPVQIETNWGIFSKKSDKVKWVLQGDIGAINDGRLTSDLVFFAGMQTGIKIKVAQHKGVYRSVYVTGGFFHPFSPGRRTLAWSGNLYLETVYCKKNNLPINPKFGVSFLYYDNQPYFGIAFHVGFPFFSSWVKKRL